MMKHKTRNLSNVARLQKLPMKLVKLHIKVPNNVKMTREITINSENVFLISMPKNYTAYTCWTSRDLFQTHFVTRNLSPSSSSQPPPHDQYHQIIINIITSSTLSYHH